MGGGEGDGEGVMSGRREGGEEGVGRNCQRHCEYHISSLCCTYRVNGERLCHCKLLRITANYCKLLQITACNVTLETRAIGILVIIDYTSYSNIMAHKSIEFSSHDLPVSIQFAYNTKKLGIEAQ